MLAEEEQYNLIRHWTGRHGGWASISFFQSEHSTGCLSLLGESRDSRRPLLRTALTRTAQCVISAMFLFRTGTGAVQNKNMALISHWAVPKPKSLPAPSGHREWVHTTLPSPFISCLYTVEWVYCLGNLFKCDFVRHHSNSIQNNLIAGVKFPAGMNKNKILICHGRKYF